MEFKKLSAVDVVESVSDTAKVLIEENGVIKRAPKDEIGSILPNNLLTYDIENPPVGVKDGVYVGGGEYDAVFHAFFGDDWCDLNQISVDNVVLVSGGYENIKNKLINQDEMPKVILRWQARYGDYRYCTLQFNSMYVEDYDDSNVLIEGLFVDTGDILSIRVLLSSDNSIVEISVNTI